MTVEALCVLIEQCCHEGRRRSSHNRTDAYGTEKEFIEAAVVARGDRLLETFAR